MADLELNPNLNIHENGSNHGQTPDLHLNIHEIGSIHGQTPIRTSQSKPQFDDFYYISKIGRFDKSAISGVRSLLPEGITPETVARLIGLPVEEVKALPEKVWNDLPDR